MMSACNPAFWALVAFASLAEAQLDRHALICNIQDSLSLIARNYSERRFMDAKVKHFCGDCT